MKLIVGLGNPGKKYQNSRHNLGFEVVDALAHKLLVHSSRQGRGSPRAAWFMDKKFKSEILEINKLPTTNSKLLLALPATYMNNSGLAVKLLVDFYKIPLSDLIIIHDDLDLNLGKIKIRQGGSGAGHHGVESIIKSLEGDEFIRVKLGIATPSLQSSERGGQAVDVDRFVLKKFMPSERSRVRRMIKEVVEAMELLLKEGLEKAQNKYN
ncbi:aminoacyl-tRNA hydrolase [Patescibacteria group bacterium]|nr:aminoacyl-tRNA hydrolase [Patescibacteria group bacterium]